MNITIKSTFDCVVFLDGEKINECKSSNTCFIDLKEGKHIISVEDMQDKLSYKREDYCVFVDNNNFSTELTLLANRNNEQISLEKEKEISIDYIINKNYETNPKWFRFRGRRRRSSYVMVYLAWVLYNFLLRLIEEGGIENYEAALFLLLFYIPLMWLSISANTQRCHDLGKSGWWQLVPFYGFWLLFAKGDEGDNIYGPEPK